MRASSPITLASACIASPSSSEPGNRTTPHFIRHRPRNENLRSRGWRVAPRTSSLLRRFVPEAAGIGTDFVAEQNLAVMPSELEFEIDQDNAALVQEFAQDSVDLQRHRVDFFEFIRGRPSKDDRMLAKNQRIVKWI